MYCRHHSTSKVFKCVCFMCVIWFKMLCALFLFSPLFFFCFFTSRKNLRVQSRKTTWDVPAFFGCLTNRIAQEQHFPKSSITCMRLQKQQTTAVISATEYIYRIRIRNIRSAPDFLSFHSWIHLYYVHTLLSATRSTC